MQEVASVNEGFDLHLKNRTSTDFQFKEGKIIFFNLQTDDEVGISLIELKEEFQKKSIFTNLINYIISNKSINRIWIFQAVTTMALILQTRKFDGKYFQNCFTGEFAWVRSPEYNLERMSYNHQKAQEISEKLSLPMNMLKTHSFRDVQDIINKNNYYRRYVG